MSYLHDENDDEMLNQPRELTLSTSTILGIFFGLVLLCGAFFAFGFNMGSKAHQAPITEGESTGSATNFDNFKPAPGAPAIQPVPGYMSPKEAEAANKAAANTSYNPAASPAYPPPVTATGTAPRTSGTVSASGEAPFTTVPPATRPAPVSRPPAPPAASDISGSFAVQVAAVSHQEDADLLVSALQRKGYAVISRSEPQDKLIHIQIGPFSSRKDAESMRQRLLADGYNAILK